MESSPPQRPSMNDIFQLNSSTHRSSRVQRIVNSLKWRQQYQTSDTYPYSLEDGRSIALQQIINGEMKGLGTGAVVWPAAHVLSKYLELHYASQLSSMRVCDVGCGTGCVGLVAALLGADVTLTDLDCVAKIIESNIENARYINPSLRCIYQCYDWDVTAEHLRPPFDLILISDCVLPKLYPIEPLVKAVDRLMNDDSVALFSYEQRLYPYFDPREEFTRLAALYNLHVAIIPISQHHDFYSSDEIEIWRVTRIPPSATNASLELSSFGAVESVEARTAQYRWHVTQRPNGDIGCCIWASSVIVSRYLLKERAELQTHHIQRPVALDVGAGCGLVSMVLSLLGYDVIAVDKSSVMDTLQLNISSFNKELSGVGTKGHITCLEFDWMKCTCDDIKRLQGYTYDRIVLSDCFYESFSVAPLLDVIAKV